MPTAFDQTLDAIDALHAEDPRSTTLADGTSMPQELAYAQLMRAAGYADEDAIRAATIIGKKGLGRDPDVQALEDCACLVFLENYFADFSRKIEHDHMVRIVQMTWRKMSPRAHALALKLPMSNASLALVKEALGAE